MTQISAPEIQYLLEPHALRAGMAADVTTGLTAASKWLAPKYFYDDRGSELFDEITRLEEYYPTRAERGLLQRYADEIAVAADAEVLLELGSGSSEKTRWLLDAMDRTGRLGHYVPVDVSDGALRLAGENLRGLEAVMHPIVADFERHLPDLPVLGRRLVAFLGGTLGNFVPKHRGRFLAALADAMAPGESFLLGVDLVKDPERLVRAYDDASGVTAEFNRNVLRVINRDLGGDFDIDAFAHHAVWNADEEWIEMRLRALRDTTVTIRDLDLAVQFAAGEELRTEISAKFRRERIEAELDKAGLAPSGWWTDGDYALVLASKVA